MNALQAKFGDRGFAVIGFPCNQFGHQENSKNDEILNVLKHVRPGGGFEPAFDLTEKVEVNGFKQDALWTWLKESLPTPHDDVLLAGAREGASTSEFISGDGGSILWKPVRRYDVAWNFEKFLIGPDGAPVKRYSRFYDTNAIAADIDALL